MLFKPRFLKGTIKLPKTEEKRGWRAREREIEIWRIERDTIF